MYGWDVCSSLYKLNSCLISFKKLDKTLSECTIMIQKCKIPLQWHFWTKMCLLIDVVGYSYGATNYENTAVQFF